MGRNYSWFFILFLFYLLAGALRLADYSWNYSALFGFGCYSQEACFARANDEVLPGEAVVFKSGGYDGQFYYYIAAELYSDHIARLDDDALRRARIAYPLLTGWAIRGGPELLMAAMIALPLLYQLIALGLLFSVAKRSEQFQSQRERTLLSLIFIFNPFALLCFWLQLADGLALSLGVIGVLLKMKSDDASPGQGGVLLILASLAVALSLLAKETLIVIPLGLSAHAALQLWRGDKRAFKSLLCWFASMLPAIFWWLKVGFLSGRTAAHGQLPFVGVINYLQAPDALLSPRGVLLLILTVSLVLALRLLHGYLFIRGPFSKESFSSADRWTAVLIANLALILAAGGEEYWSNFANIARFFTPLVLVVAMWRLEGGGRAGLERKLYLLLLGLTLVLTLVMMIREASGGGLPFEVWPGSELPDR